MDPARRPPDSAHDPDRLRNGAKHYSKALAAWEAGTRRFGSEEQIERVRASGGAAAQGPQSGKRIARAAVFAAHPRSGGGSVRRAAMGTPNPTLRGELENGRIVFPKDSAQLGSFATEPVRESARSSCVCRGAWCGTKPHGTAVFSFRRARDSHPVKAGDRVKRAERWGAGLSDFGQAQSRCAPRAIRFRPG